MRPLVHQRDHIGLEGGHPEPRQVGLEGDTGPVVALLAGGDDGLLLDRHVGLEDLGGCGEGGKVLGSRVVRYIIESVF